jgi:lipopolysaccharide transport system ATP-binding protein
MSSNVAIKVENLSKAYQIYGQPHDRLKQSIFPRLLNFFGKAKRNYYHEFLALKGISFEINKGETVGIIGRNGSGKSSLLQLICGTLYPSSGNIQTTGRIAALLELGSGFNPDFTGRENVYMNAAVLGLTRDEVNERFDSIIAFADIGEFLDQPVRTYSSGMSVRLAFAVAINVDPQILIIDEALSVGDELFQRKCFSRIEEIKKSGATILFVSHAGGTVIELCDRAILIDSGELLQMGLPKAVVGNYQKLIYAPNDARDQIRADIKRAKTIAPVDFKSVGMAADIKEAQLIEGDVEYFDPYFISEAVLTYQTQGALISKPAIYTLSGKKINWLRTGAIYKYSYEVVFEKECHDVRFGMMIKGINGIEIGGLGSASSGHGLDKVLAGQNVQITFTFQCHLLPGSYFINAGCSGKINGENIFLHRLIDAVAFRIMPIKHEEDRAGYVDFATKVGCSVEFIS